MKSFRPKGGEGPRGGDGRNAEKDPGRRHVNALPMGVCVCATVVGVKRHANDLYLST